MVISSCFIRVEIADGSWKISWIINFVEDSFVTDQVKSREEILKLGRRFRSSAG